jgi:ppGpp synthetase/RelA/SpoT-type nucleotidyltranferase
MPCPCSDSRLVPIKATDASRRLLDTMLDRHDKTPLGSVALDEQVKRVKTRIQSPASIQSKLRQKAICLTPDDPAHD